MQGAQTVANTSQADDGLDQQELRARGLKKKPKRIEQAKNKRQPNIHNKPNHEKTTR